jgi:prepilin-type N-terminal cleavage/methylation domain-containing protein
MNRNRTRVARPRHSAQRGLTLVELLVVIAVLGALAAIVIFNVTGVTGRGTTAACKTDLESLQTAVFAYYEDNNQSFPTAGGGAGSVVMADVVPVYLHTAPTNTGAVTIDATGSVSAASC